MPAQFERCPNASCRGWFIVSEQSKTTEVSRGVFGSRLPEPVNCPHCGETARQARTSGWWDTTALSDTECAAMEQKAAHTG